VPSPRSRRRGFTLAEIMIGAALGSMVLAGIMSTYLMLLRSGVSASNYSVMEAQARRAFEQLGIDARMSSALSSGGTTPVTSVTLTVPNNYTSNSNNVTYAYDSTNQWFYLVPGDGSVLTNRQILIRNVTGISFNRYDASGTATSTDTAAKHIQVSVTVQRSAARVVTESETILSAAFTMRNKL
jgi:prepilin-type N-terminal cleavage/methylation domain-containing protein